MNDEERTLAAWAARQHQVFSRDQARASGLSNKAIARRVASGSFVVVGPQARTFGGVTLDWRGQVHAGLLDLGPGALVSGKAAAALHQLDGYGPGPLVSSHHEAADTGTPPASSSPHPRSPGTTG